MVLSRDESASPRDVGGAPTSVPDMARALRAAREGAGLSLPDAAAGAGLEVADLEALESGTVGRMRDRVETLRALRTYADSLGLPGNEYALITITLWPIARTPRPADSGAHPVVSVTVAPAGGHGTVWAGDRTGVTDSAFTGMVGGAPPLSIHDTGPIPIVDTGEVPVVSQSAPKLLKVLVSIVALMVVLSGVGLLEHTHVTGWYDAAKTSVSRWYADAKRASGLSPKQTAFASESANGKALPKVDIVQNPGTDNVVFNVHASSFKVKMAAFGRASWIQATDANSQQPIFSDVLPGGQTHLFTITNSLTIETASTSARAYLYWHNRFIGYYFPSKVPFNMTFNAVG